MCLIWVIQSTPNQIYTSKKKKNWKISLKYQKTKKSVGTSFYQNHLKYQERGLCRLKSQNSSPYFSKYQGGRDHGIKRGLCTNESIRNQAPSCGESKLFFALNIGKCHLKKNYEEKSYPHLSFFGEKKINFI